VTALDLEIASLLRRASRPVVLVANKVEGDAQEASLAELFRLGVGEPVPVSAEHGRGVAEMLEVVRDRLRREGDEAAPAPPPRDASGGASARATAIAVIGRPNVGKSSLVNALVGNARVLVHDQPGTTRDAVDTPFTYRDRPYVLIDTAGIRRKGKVTEALEKLSVVMALRSLERCDAALVLLDASEGLTSQDAHIAGYANEAGRASVIAVNKWDLVPPGMVRRAEVVEQIRDRLPFLDYAPVCFTSAVTRQGLPELFDMLDRVAEESRRRVPDGELRRVLTDALARRPISIRGVPLTLQSAAQLSTAPPTFMLRVNRPREVHFSYQRYLVNALRGEFGFLGSPIRVVFRQAVGKKARRVQRRS
jgi:GTP-binding protein